jgi:uncharacterized membrane protein YeiH
MPLRYDPAVIAGFLVVLDLAGTFVFALSGAMAGVRHRLDVFGVLVLSFAAGNAGGLTRDLILGATPPPAIGDWRYIGVSLAAGLLTFFCAPIIRQLRCRRARALCSLGHTQGPGGGTQPPRGDAARRPDRRWWRNAA